MPFITVKQLAGRTEEQRAEIARELTAAYARATGMDPANVWVVVEEVPAENWAAGGETFAAKRARAAASGS
ncbi:4-oxalocrotonate tautomerase family protein [Kitasatospora sp. NPDC085879]|uniref:tautomerase family protein n=1 Tax=Kitasatospora sp. NPDC085879 TaxID=3154769 RepID=UPI000BB15BB8|nr:4-oxalocrotonate tautomerase family protein [Streptomyces sp. TLI_235]PBC78395.1 4-oxalocrotonate tautomerase [Streptomyces sp. TLI_235]